MRTLLLICCAVVHFTGAITWIRTVKHQCMGMRIAHRESVTTCRSGCEALSDCEAYNICSGRCTMITGCTRLIESSCKCFSKANKCGLSSATTSPPLTPPPQATTEIAPQQINHTTADAIRSIPTPTSPTTDVADPSNMTSTTEEATLLKSDITLSEHQSEPMQLNTTTSKQTSPTMENAAKSSTLSSLTTTVAVSVRTASSTAGTTFATSIISVTDTLELNTTAKLVQQNPASPEYAAMTTSTTQPPYTTTVAASVSTASATAGTTFATSNVSVTETIELNTTAKIMKMVQQTTASPEYAANTSSTSQPPPPQPMTQIYSNLTVPEIISNKSCRDKAIDKAAPCRALWEGKGSVSFARKKRVLPVANLDPACSPKEQIVRDVADCVSKCVRDPACCMFQYNDHNATCVLNPNQTPVKGGDEWLNFFPAM